MGVSGQRHAPAALLPPGKGPPVPIVCVTEENMILEKQLRNVMMMMMMMMMMMYFVSRPAVLR
jgi:hypothetical protein